MDDTDEAIKDFLIEGYENVDLLDRDLIKLEKDPGADNTLSTIFRTIHTLKGSSGFLAFSKLESLAHCGENLLSGIRDRKLVADSEIITALLAMVDAIRQILSTIEAQKSEGDGDFSALIDRLTGLSEKGTKIPAIKSKAKEPSSKSKAPPRSSIAKKQPSKTKTPSRSSKTKKQSTKTETLPPKSGLKESALDSNQFAAELHQKVAGAVSVIPILSVQKDNVGTNPKEPTESEFSTLAVNPLESNLAPISDNSVRVSVDLLDKLMNLVGELVLARNQILQFKASQEDVTFTAASQRLNMITSELQERIMKTRMQPIGIIWNKFPRVVRDLATAKGKEVGLHMVGKETELDKSIIEAIKDPLTHLVRNAVDHGIESPADRQASGKEPKGNLWLRAYHEGGQVNIEFRDDGAGIDPKKIKEQALNRNLINHEQALQMNDREVLDLIFMPGFSTAKKITNVSGRGVGMDVVKNNIERIGGHVDIISSIGQGSTFRIKIPLTLAIIPALIISSGGDRYAIPQVNLLELVRLEDENASHHIEMMHGAPVYRLRGKLLPLIYLNEALQGEEKLHRTPVRGQTNDVVKIVVVQAENRDFGLVVDEINDTQEIVVKPLWKQLKRISTFAGATIMGDGKVALILDVLAIAQNSGVLSSTRERILAEQKDTLEKDNENTQPMLLLKGPSGGQMGMPLTTVARLEKLKCSEVEKVGDVHMIQYRGEILPLLQLSSLFSNQNDRSLDHDIGASGSKTGSLHVVVCSHRNHSLGVVVDNIFDIVTDSITMKGPPTRKGCLCSAVIRGKVTELIDINMVLNAADQIFQSIKN